MTNDETIPLKKSEVSEKRLFNSAGVVKDVCKALVNDAASISGTQNGHQSPFIPHASIIQNRKHNYPTSNFFNRSLVTTFLKHLQG